MDLTYYIYLSKYSPLHHWSVSPGHQSPDPVPGPPDHWPGSHESPETPRLSQELESNSLISIFQRDVMIAAAVTLSWLMIPEGFPAFLSQMRLDDLLLSPQQMIWWQPPPPEYWRWHYPDSSRCHFNCPRPGNEANMACATCHHRIQFQSISYLTLRTQS